MEYSVRYKKPVISSDIKRYERIVFLKTKPKKDLFWDISTVGSKECLSLSLLRKREPYFNGGKSNQSFFRLLLKCGMGRISVSRERSFKDFVELCWNILHLI